MYCKARLSTLALLLVVKLPTHSCIMRPAGQHIQMCLDAVYTWNAFFSLYSAFLFFGQNINWCWAQRSYGQLEKSCALPPLSWRVETKTGDFLLIKKIINQNRFFYIYSMSLLSVVLSLFDFKAPNVHNNIQRPYNVSVACDLLDTN